MDLDVGVGVGVGVRQVGLLVVIGRGELDRISQSISQSVSRHYHHFQN